MLCFIVFLYSTIVLLKRHNSGYRMIKFYTYKVQLSLYCVLIIYLLISILPICFLAHVRRIGQWVVLWETVLVSRWPPSCVMQWWVNPQCQRWLINTLRPRQNGRHCADDNFKYTPIGNIPSLVQIMAWRRPGDKPLSEPMLFSLPTHICVTRSQWSKMSK